MMVRIAAALKPPSSMAIATPSDSYSRDCASASARTSGDRLVIASDSTTTSVATRAPWLAFNRSRCTRARRDSFTDPGRRHIWMNTLRQVPIAAPGSNSTCD